MRNAVGGLASACFCGGGVGSVAGRLEEAGLGRGGDGVRMEVARGDMEVEGEREGGVCLRWGEGGWVGGWDWSERRWMASLEASSRMILAL